MKRKLTLLFTLFIIMALLLAACGGGEEEPAAETSGEAAAEEEMAAEEGGGEEEMAAEEEAAAEEQTLLIGFTASQTGRYNTESSRQINGLDLWMEGINDTGLVMPDGSVIRFDAVFYDDESNTDRVQELYTRLATEDNADFLISPYSSGLTDASAIIAEQYGKVMITTGAASDSTYQKGFQNVFQTYTPASRYLTGALDLLQSTDPEAQKLAIVYENSKFSTDVATALNDYAEELGYEIVLFEGYDPETTDFAPFINKIQESEPDAIMGGGHFQDGSTFVKQLEEKQVPVNMVSLLVAPPDPSFAELGDAAMGVVGPSQWEPLADFNAAKASEEGMDFYGPSSAEFTQAYVDAYGEEPSYHAAGGYVAGLLLQKAIEDAASTDPEAIRQALENLDLMTFFGHMQFDTSAESHGLQIGHSMIYVQWQDEGGQLVKQVVWPTAGSTADTLYPMP